MQVKSYTDARFLVGDHCGGPERTLPEGLESDHWYYVPTDEAVDPDLDIDRGTGWFVNKDTGELVPEMGGSWSILGDDGHDCIRQYEEYRRMHPVDD